MLDSKMHCKGGKTMTCGVEHHTSKETISRSGNLSEAMDGCVSLNSISLEPVTTVSPPQSPSSPKDTAVVKINDSVVINIGGIRYETLRDTLDRFPGSRLSSLDEASPHYRKVSDEYFFDRHAGVFATILDYYRTQELHIPENVCSATVKKEFDFWGIDEHEMEQCCWVRYRSQQVTHSSLVTFRKSMTAHCAVDPHALTRWQRVRRRMWDFLDEPKTSKAAKVYAVFSFMVTLLSITVLCCETHPSFKANMSASDYADIYRVDALELLNYWYGNYSMWPESEKHHMKTRRPPSMPAAHGPAQARSPGPVQDPGPSQGSGPAQPTDPSVQPTDPSSSTVDPTGSDVDPGDKRDYRRSQKLAPPNKTLQRIDQACMCFFCFELVVRFVFCPSKLRFFLNALNVIDILSIVPFFIEIIINYIDREERYRESAVDGAVIVLKVLRIFCILRLVRHHSGLRVLLYTICASWRELLLLNFFLFIGMVLFASLVFYADIEKDTFTSIPHAFWWAIVTMTTLGYGDMVPNSDIGYLVGAMCAVSGVLLMAFTVPSIVNNFMMFYRDAQYGNREGHRFEAAPYVTKGVSDPSKVNSCTVEKTPANPVEIATHF